jgi:hypothetical protein
MDLHFISIDGRCNNRMGHTEFGSLPQNYLRMIRPVYPIDGSGAAMPTTPVSPRRISEIVFEQNNSVGDRWDRRGLSNWIVEFGQFFNHERHLNGASGGIFHPIEPILIPVAADDSFFLPANPIPTARSEFAPNTGTSKNVPRVPINTGSTAWIDGQTTHSTRGERERGEHAKMKRRPSRSWFLLSCLLCSLFLLSQALPCTE